MAEIKEKNFEGELPTDMEPSSSNNGAIKKVKKEDAKKDAKEGAKKDAKKDAKEKAEYINLTVIGSCDRVANFVEFRLKYSSPIFKLKKAYANNAGLEAGNLRFLWEGRRLADEDIPKLLDMQDKDQIEVYLEQTGGW